MLAVDRSANRSVAQADGAPALDIWGYSRVRRDRGDPVGRGPMVGCMVDVACCNYMLLECATYVSLCVCVCVFTVAVYGVHCMVPVRCDMLNVARYILPGAQCNAFCMLRWPRPLTDGHGRLHSVYVFAAAALGAHARRLLQTADFAGAAIAANKQTRLRRVLRVPSRVMHSLQACAI